MARSKATIYDIAEQLRITPSTVSRALSDHPRISEKTKKAVKDMAKSLNYQHNSIAAALRSGKTYILGVMIPTTNRSFFSSVIRGIEQVASEAGYNVMITQSNDLKNLEQSNIEALMRTQVDGVIASIARETTEYAHFQRIMEDQVPLVLFDRVTEIPNASTVVIDDYLGAYQAVEHLIRQGCRRIAHFTGEQHLNIYKYRLQGYRQALVDNGLQFQEQLVVQSKLQIEDGRQGMMQLLQLNEPPDAVFSASDYSAIGAMQVLKEMDLHIPEDMALVGFADEPFTSFVDPGLTSVNQLSEQMGQAAAQIILEELKETGREFEPKKLVLTPQLVVRGSSLKLDR